MDETGEKHLKGGYSIGLALAVGAGRQAETLTQMTEDRPDLLNIPEAMTERPEVCISH